MSSGLFNVGSYQASGNPYLTGSLIEPGQQHLYVLPAVTKRIQIQIDDVSGSVGAVRVHFADAANNNVMGGSHYWTVSKTAAQSSNLDATIKCTKIYITGQSGAPVRYQILAELTNISAQEMFVLTGSGISL